MASTSGQAGIETMLLYAIVILVAGGVIVYVVNTGVLSPNLCSKQKYGFSALSPSDWGVYRDTNNVLVSIANVGYEDVEVTGASASLSGLVGCSADLENPKMLLPSEGFVIELNCSPSGAVADNFVLGACYNADLTIAFNYLSGRQDTSRGRLTGPVEEGATAPQAVTSTTLVISTTTTTTTTTTSTTTTTTTTTTFIILPNSDVVLVADLSDTMILCLDGSLSGCTAVDGNNPVRWEFANALYSDFITRVLERPGNRLGMVAYGENVTSSVPGFIDLTDDSGYLISQLSSYQLNKIPGVGNLTCTSCGIRMARKMLEEQSSPLKNRYIVLVTDGVSNYFCPSPYPSMTSARNPGYCCDAGCGLSDNRYVCIGWGTIYYLINSSSTCDCAKATGGVLVACSGWYDNFAIDNSVDSACDAVSSLGPNFWVYSIGMVNQEFYDSCGPGRRLLDEVAECGGGESFLGYETEALEEIFQRF